MIESKLEDIQLQLTKFNELSGEDVFKLCQLYNYKFINYEVLTPVMTFTFEINSKKYVQLIYLEDL